MEKRYEFLHVRYEASKRGAILAAKAQAMLEGRSFGEWLLKAVEEHLKAPVARA